MPNRTFVSGVEIIREYKEGRRDFSNITSQNCNFVGLDLSGASFKNSDLSFSSFVSAVFKNCDFTDALLTWCDFTKTDFRGSNFTKAVMSWSRFEDTKLDNTDLTCTNISWSLFLNTDKMKARSIKGIVESGVITDLSQLDAMDIPLLASKIEELKNKIPHDLYLRLKSKITENREHIGKGEMSKDSFYDMSLGSSSGNMNVYSIGESGGAYEMGHKKKKEGYDK
jgi:hypothetical protein